MDGGIQRLAVAVVALALLLSGCMASNLQALGSDDPARRDRAAEALANTADSALPQLEKLVEKRDYAKYPGIAQTLERIGGDRAKMALQTMALDTGATREARQTALSALLTLDRDGVYPWIREMAAQGQAAEALDTAKVLLTLPGDAGAQALRAVFTAAPDAEVRTAALQAMFAGRDLLTPWLDGLQQASQYAPIADAAGLLEQPDPQQAFDAWLRIAGQADAPAELRRQAVERLFALRYDDAMETMLTLRAQGTLTEELMGVVLSSLRPVDTASRVEMLITEAGRASGDDYRTVVLSALRSVGEGAYRSLYRAVIAAGMQGSAALRSRDMTTPEGVLCALGRPAADYLVAQEIGDTDDASLRYFEQLLCAFGPDGQAAWLQLTLRSVSANGPGFLVDALLQAGNRDGAFNLLKQVVEEAQDAERLTLCAQLLSKSFGADARAVLEPMLLSQEGSRRSAALKAFETLPGATAVDTLKAMAATGNDDTAQAAMNALAAIGSDEGDAALVALAQQADLSQQRRMRAAKLLLQAADGKHIPAIQALLTTVPEDLRVELLRSLADLKTAPAATAMTTAAPLSNQQQRLELVRLLLDMGDPGKAALAALTGDLLKPFSEDVAALIAEGMEGSEPLLGLVLNAYGTLDMANTFLNSGSKTLYDSAVDWGKKNGYKVVSNTGAAEGVSAWGSGKVQP